MLTLLKKRQPVRQKRVYSHKNLRMKTQFLRVRVYHILRVGDISIDITYQERNLDTLGERRLLDNLKL